MPTAVNRQSLIPAPRRMAGRRLRGPTPTRPSASRAMTFGMVEDVRLRQLPYVAILSLALVALLESVHAGALLAMGQPCGIPELIRDLSLKTPWAIIVCIALWSGLTFGRGSAVVAGLVAWVAAPIASLTAHALAEIAATYTLSAMHEMLISPYLVAAQKGVAYVVLALLVLWLWTQTRATAWQHAVAGLTVGLLFGGALLLLEAERVLHPMTASVLIAGLVNEVLFPIGCALLLWHVRAVDRVAARRGRVQDASVRNLGARRRAIMRRATAARPRRLTDAHGEAH